MDSEKIINPPSGYMAFALFLLLGVVAILCFATDALIVALFLTVIDLVIILPGMAIINPNESKVLTLFGQYLGTVKQDGFFWVNPFTVKKKISLRIAELQPRRRGPSDPFCRHQVLDQT